MDSFKIMDIVLFSVGQRSREFIIFKIKVLTSKIFIFQC